MNYDIHITNAAQRDLLNAADHIEFILKNPKAADALLDEAEKQIYSLTDFPEKFCLVDDPVLSSWGLRFVIVNNYLAFYTIDYGKNMVIIVRFLYQKSDWNAILHQGISII
ncbi:MAG: type II toxin-antitoxin system RelE/ParE family toxin [Lachnospiraceae bacterium]|nr:type II toxin-antitoxin system RelE/ParE family toxin [Lachnospiraceae bacterium]